MVTCATLALQLRVDDVGLVDRDEGRLDPLAALLALADRADEAVIDLASTADPSASRGRPGRRPSRSSRRPAWRLRGTPGRRSRDRRAAMASRPAASGVPGSAMPFQRSGSSACPRRRASPCFSGRRTTLASLAARRRLRLGPARESRRRPLGARPRSQDRAQPPDHEHREREKDDRREIEGVLHEPTVPSSPGRPVDAGNTLRLIIWRSARYIQPRGQRSPARALSGPTFRASPPPFRRPTARSAGPAVRRHRGPGPRRMHMADQR